MFDPNLAATNRARFEELHGIKVLNWDTLPTMSISGGRHGLPSPVQAIIKHTCVDCKVNAVETTMWRPGRDTPSLLCQDCIQARDEAFYGVKILNWASLPKIQKGVREGFVRPLDAILEYHCPTCQTLTKMRAFAPCNKHEDMRCMACRTGDASMRSPGAMVAIPPGGGGVPKSDAWKARMSSLQKAKRSIRPTEEQKSDFELAFGTKLLNWDQIMIQSVGNPGWPRMRETMAFNCRKCGGRSERLMLSGLMSKPSRACCESCNLSDAAVINNNFQNYNTENSAKKKKETWVSKIRGIGTAENDLVRKQIEKKLGSLVKNWDHLRFTTHGNPAVKQQKEDDRDSGSQRFSQALIFTCQRCGDEASLIFNSLSSLPSICKHCTASINSMGRAICFRSQPEKDLESFINSMGFTAEVSNREVIKPHEADLYIPEKKLAIEYNGLYWHSDEFQEDNYHLQKTVKANKCGIRLIQIFEDEWIEKRSVVEHRLRHILGKAVQRVGARKCEVIKVDKEQGNQFFESYHIQGTTICQDIYGLKHGEQIVACMSFGRRFTLAEEIEDDTEELIRFATACHVPGAASKLLKAWMDDHPGVSLLSFADRRWSNGGVYESLGFKQIRETRPAYWYVHSQKRLNRMGFSKSRLVAMGYDPKMTEKEIMEERGYLCVYDAGSLVYRLDPQTT